MEVSEQRNDIADSGGGRKTWKVVVFVIVILLACGMAIRSLLMKYRESELSCSGCSVSSCPAQSDKLEVSCSYLMDDANSCDVNRPLAEVEK